MSSRHLTITDDIVAYLQRAAFREHPALAALRARNASLPEASLQIGPEQGALLALLVRLLGARRILEIGTFTGYSSTAMALALADGGSITCLDVSREWTDLARRTWEEAGVGDRVDLRIGPAHESLAMLDENAYDLAFIDADKERYDAYYEGCLRVVRRGGLIALDNTLRHGRVADPSAKDAGDVAIRELNAKIVADERVDMVLLPIADGLTLARIR